MAQLECDGELPPVLQMLTVLHRKKMVDYVLFFHLLIKLGCTRVYG